MGVDPTTRRVPSSRAAGSAPSSGLRIAIIMLGIGALLALASGVITLAAHLQDPHVTRGIGSGTYAVPSVFLALLFALSAWAGAQGSRGLSIVMSIVTLLCAVVMLFVVGILLGYDCMDYNANPLTMTGCKGSLPSPTDHLITGAIITIALTPLVALAAIVAASIRASRKQRGDPVMRRVPGSPRRRRW